MKFGGWLVLVLVLSAAAGCGSSASSICDAGCDCTGCSDAERDSCIDDYEDLEKEAGQRGCDNQVDDYLACVDDELACIDGEVDLDGCGFEEEALSKCLQ